MDSVGFTINRFSLPSPFLPVLQAEVEAHLLLGLADSRAAEVHYNLRDVVLPWRTLEMLMPNSPANPQAL